MTNPSGGRGNPVGACSATASRCESADDKAESPDRRVRTRRRDRARQADWGAPLRLSGLEARRGGGSPNSGPLGSGALRRSDEHSGRAC
jgi:hypothetical protein